MHLISVLCYFLIFSKNFTWGRVVSAVGTAPPQVHISFPDVGDKDFQNETMAVITNSNPDFEMLCTADYPVEWILHYEQGDDGISETTKMAETRRYAKTFEDVTSYNYTARLRMAYRGNLLVLTNFTCQRTGVSDGLQRTHVRMSYQKGKTLIILEILKNHSRISAPPAKTGNNRCDSAIAIVHPPPPDGNKVTPCFRCEQPGDGKQLELDFHQCLSPIQCQSTLSSHKKGKTCLRNVTKEPDLCKFNGQTNFNPGLVLCKNSGSALAQFYFFGLYRGDSLDDDWVPAPPVYFDWEDANPLEMLYIHPLTQDRVYLGQAITITCEYSRYYYSLGSWFGLYTEADPVIEYIQATDMRPCIRRIESPARHNCTEDEEWRGTYVSTINFTLKHVGPHRVYCFGPVWNSPSWVNTSLSFNVETGVSPKIISVIPIGDPEFVVGQLDRELMCTYFGRPVPNVTWTTTASERQYKSYQKDNYTSVIQFFEIGYKTAGRYTCHVASYLGQDSKYFDIKAAAPPTLSTTAIVVISLAVAFVVVIIFVVIWRMRQIIRAQQETLRALTEAEINEFILGNPDLLRAQGNAYFNSANTIEALPYKAEYEIPRDKLFVDHAVILGQGEFGVVHKGTVEGSIVSHYAELCDRVLETERLEVAVKICKGKLDVVNFKALLSEIKVMTYLGSHEHIVSLIGASTVNIRERELFIAVEFCENGSLKNYVQERKKNFVAEKDRSEDSLTLKMLLQWTRHIAEGLEYIHSKRIIHADLAIRNVLLTTNLTAKIGDFGLSRQLVDSASYTKTTKCALPWRNMAIESLKNLTFSVKSDMWSFGVTIWELFTLGDTPYPGLNYTMEFTSLLETGLRLYKPPLVSNSMYDYMLLCWTIEPNDRPYPADVIPLCAKEENKMESSSYLLITPI